jgi:hypothetical protein
LGKTIDSSNTVWVSLQCLPDPLAAIKKYALEHLSFDRLLQDQDLRKPAIDTFDSISGHKTNGTPGALTASARSKPFLHQG